MGRGYAKSHVFKDNVTFTAVLHPTKYDNSFTKTKVCITMGPSLNDVDLVCELLEAGATCARIDLTWQMLDNHRRSLQILQEAMRRTRRLCAVMLDCLGRDILVRRPFREDERGWPVYFQSLNVEAGQKVVITTDPEAECTDSRFPITYTKFPAMVQPGDSIFLGRYLVSGADDSSLYLEVEEVRETEVVCEAKNKAKLDGLLTVFHQERSEEGLSNLQNDMPALCEWDKEAVAALCSEFEVDFLTLSYCRSPEDVQEARDFLSSIRKDGIKIVAKCETRQSLLNFRSISAAADAIIISRGNLGLDVPPEKVALVQKGIISSCAKLGKPTIITRVVDTMAKSPRPTRAEATDIANAVLDGVDGIMLGAETYRGQYPLETVRTVVAICREAEEVFDHHHHFEHLQQDESLAMYSFPSENDIDSADDPEEPNHRRRMKRAGSSNSLFSEATGITAGVSYHHSIKSTPRAPGVPVPMNTKLESIASGAVRAADKVGAKLIVCITHTGRTASIIAKYRPPMPIMTLVVPYLKNEGLKWTLEGRSVARQALLTCGLMPVLAAPTPAAGESLLEEAIALAACNGLVNPHDHVVAVSLSSSREAMVKVVSVSEDGAGIKKIRPTSLLNMLKAAGMKVQVEEPPMQKQLSAEQGAAAMRRFLSRGSVIMGKGSATLVPFDPTPEEAELPMANGVAK